MTILLFITLIVQFIVGMLGMMFAADRSDKEMPWVVSFVLIFIISLTVASTLWLTGANEPQAQIIHSNCGCEK